MHKLWLLTAAFTALVYGQTPIIEDVQNAANRGRLTSLTPQMLFTITGQNLATSTKTAGYPLPATLGGATVTIDYADFVSPFVTNTAPAPLLYASATQINAQAPSWLQAFVDNSGRTIGVTVTTAAGVSNTYLVQLQPANLGIFTQDYSGCGQAMAFNIHSDGSPITMNTPQNSFDPERDLGLAILLTGAGFVADRMDGVGWLFNPEDNLAPPVATANGPSGPIQVLFGVPNWTGIQYGLVSQYVGPAIGYAGIDQVNAIANWGSALQWTVPAQGCRVPMYLTYGASTSQIVDVSIHSGGGACVDSAADTLGIVEWQKTVVSQRSGVSSSAAITAQFVQSAGLGFPAPGPLGAPPSDVTEVAYQNPLPASCPAVVPTLDAGSLTVAGPGLGSQTLSPMTQNGQITYQASVPAGSMQGGAYQVSGLGGTQVGSFNANGQMPAPIMITTNLQPGTNVPGATNSSTDNYTFAWTGGDDQSLVTLDFIVQNSVYPASAPFHVAISAPASAHQIGIADFYYGGGCFGPPCFGFVIPQGNVELIFTQSPVTAPSQPFSASGLGMGGELTWRYVFDYKGLTNWLPPPDRTPS